MHYLVLRVVVGRDEIDEDITEKDDVEDLLNNLQRRWLAIREGQVEGSQEAVGNDQPKDKRWILRTSIL
jgi:hypothetical protein